MNPIVRFVYRIHPKVAAAFVVSVLVAAAQLADQAEGLWPDNGYVRTVAVFLPVLVAYAKRAESLVAEIPEPPGS